MTFPAIFTSPPSKETPSFASVVITPSIADYCLSHFAFPRQRALRAWLIDQYVASMQAGTFQRNSILVFAWCNGRIFCINGNHRLHAIAKANIMLPCIIQMCDCPTFEDVCTLYRMIDDGLPRNAGDRFRAMSFADEHNITETLQQRLFGAIGLIMGGFTDAMHKGSTVASIHRDAARVVLFMADWVPEAREYDRVLASTAQKVKQHYLQARTMSVALITLRYVPDHAAVFWKKAAGMKGFEEGDPEMVLHQWLNANDVANKAAKLIHPRYIAAAWNARITDKGVLCEDGCQRLVGRKRTLPFQLNGTPFRGKEDLWFIGADGNPVHEPIPKPSPQQAMIREAIASQLEPTEQIVDALGLPSLKE